MFRILTIAVVVCGIAVSTVQADPPEVRPGEGTTLRVLFADPKGDGREVTIAWLTCKGLLTPDVTTEDIEEIEDICEIAWLPQIRTASQGGDEYGTLMVPMDFLDDLPEGEESLTITAITLLCAGGEIPFLTGEEGSDIATIEDMCVGGESIAAFKTFEISGSDSDSEPNSNPEIESFYFDGEILLPDAAGGHGLHECASADGCREAVRIHAYFTEDSYQSYTQLVFGEETSTEERTYVSWFVTGGQFDKNRSGTKQAPGPYRAEWMPPREGGEFTLWAVAHDVRGGVSWEIYEVEAHEP